MNAELATALSDAPLALLAGGLAWHLGRRAKPRPLARYLVTFLVAVAISAALGGGWHVMRATLSSALAASWWTLTLVAIGVADAALLAAFATAAGLGLHRHLATTAILVKLGIYLAFALTLDSFLPAVADQLGTLVAGLAILAWDRTHEASLPAGPLLAGIGLAIGSGVVQAGGADLTAWLNHNVLYHLVAMAALIAFWRAGASGSTARPPA
ncbi:MAG: hypothetical protein JSR48_07500 [Verrucomicrobia bacterium]|nr:hypothetical protein [Verrucomicrobiota bacterium]